MDRRRRRRGGRAFRSAALLHEESRHRERLIRPYRRRRPADDSGRIGLAIANQAQPRYEVEPVPEAGLEDLDGAAMARTLARMRDTSRSLRDVDDETALRRIRVLVPYKNGELAPSLAGVLAYGLHHDSKTTQ